MARVREARNVDDGSTERLAREWPDVLQSEDRVERERPCLRESRMGWGGLKIKSWNELPSSLGLPRVD